MMNDIWKSFSSACAADLAGHAVDVWLVDLAVSGPIEAWYGAVLSADEWAQAGRFSTAALARRFVVSRGALRHLLAGYASLDARQLAFARGEQGKPELPPFDGGPLKFNLSHSEDTTLIAVSRSFEVGVDVEWIREGIEPASIVQENFSVNEKKAWNALPVSEQLQAFFAGWVRKESYVKGLGSGLSYPVNEYTVSLSPADGIGGVEDHRDPVEGARWRLVTLDAGQEFAASLAVRCEGAMPVVRTLRHVPPGT